MLHKKKISDRARVCAQRVDGQWKYEKKSVAGGMVCKLSVQPGAVELRQSMEKTFCH